MKAFHDRTGWRCRPRLAPGPEGRLNLALPTCATEQEADARASLIAEMLVLLEAAGQDEGVREKAARRLAQLPADEVAAEERFLRYRVCGGVYVRPAAANMTTFAELFTRWFSGELAALYPDHVRTPRSAAELRARLDKHVLPHLGDMPLRAFTRDHYDELAGRFASMPRNTRYATLWPIKRVLDIAVITRVIEHSPLPRGLLPRPEKPQFVYFYPEEIALLLACELVPLEARVFYGTLLHEGLRSAEASGMRWPQIDVRTGIVTIEHHKTMETAGPKVFKLGDDTLRALCAWREHQEPDEDRIFPGQQGRCLARQFRAHLLAAGVDRRELHHEGPGRKRACLHSTRRTFVTLALAAGRPEQWVMDRTGHTTSGMLQRYRRAARTQEEMGHVLWLPPLDGAILGLRQDRGADTPGPATCPRMPRNAEKLPLGQGARYTAQPHLPLVFPVNPAPHDAPANDCGQPADSPAAYPAAYPAACPWNVLSCSRRAA